MQKWEYKTFKADRDAYKGFFKGVKDDKFEKDINVLGKEGWELISITNQRLFFKKAV